MLVALLLSVVVHASDLDRIEEVTLSIKDMPESEAPECKALLAPAANSRAGEFLTFLERAADQMSPLETKVVQRISAVNVKQFETLLALSGLRLVGLHSLSEGFDRALVQKIGDEDAARFEWQKDSAETIAKELSVITYRLRDRREYREAIERKTVVMNVLPYQTKDGRLSVFADEAVAHPVSLWGNPLEGAGLVSGYFTDPMRVHKASLKSLNATVKSWAGDLKPAPALQIKQFFTPDLLNEETHGFLYSIPESLTDLTTGQRATDAGEILHRAHVFGVVSSELEVLIYAALFQLKLPLPPWTGEPLLLTAEGSEVPPARSWSVTAPRWKRARFPLFWRHKPILQILKAEYTPITSSGSPKKTESAEFLAPRGERAETISILPILRIQGEIYVGLEACHEPAVSLRCVPELHVPAMAGSLKQAETLAQRWLERRYNVTVNSLQTLGAPYFTDPRLTPERILPYVAEISGAVPRGELNWVPMRQLLGKAHELRSGRTLLSLYRLVHASSYSALP